MSHAETKALLRMWLTPGLGLAGCHRLLAATKNPEDVFRLARSDLQELAVRPQAIEALLSSASAERAEEEWVRAQTQGIQVLGSNNPAYPSLLKETFDPPILLYARFRDWNPNLPHIAIVGTRRPSPYGLHAAEVLSSELASRGIVVVSGMARGVDTAAHRGALARGQTVAVLGTGMDRTYPAENRELAESIRHKGALLSEFPIGTHPLPQNFPLRNRILAGMTLGTIVIEAKERSGSLITARLALEANREVFAVPGRIDAPTSTGPHQLIRQGACLISRWEDVVEELPAAIQQSLKAKRDPSDGSNAPLKLELQKVLEALSPSELMPIDLLLSKVRLSSAEIYSALLELELAGLVHQYPGALYRVNPITPKSV